MKGDKMGVKMYEARYGARIINLKQYKCEMKGKIFCKNCGTPITHVSSHLREIGECNVHVSAYFRLTNSKVNPHAAGCGYITENEIKNIYAQCCNEKDLMTKEGTSYIVRLHILVDTLETTFIEEGNICKEKKVKRSTLKYIKSGDKPAYITTLRKILKLRCQLDKDGIEEIKEKLKLKFYNGKNRTYDEISWSSFFFEYDKKSYLRAFNYISKKVYHPVVFCGRVKSVELPKENFPFYNMRIYSVKVETGKYVSLGIIFTDDKMYGKMKEYEGTNVVVYGSESYAKSSGLRKTKEGKEIEYLNVTTRIYGENQVLKVENY